MIDSDSTIARVVVVLEEIVAEIVLVDFVGVTVVPEVVEEEIEVEVESAVDDGKLVVDCVAVLVVVVDGLSKEN